MENTAPSNWNRFKLLSWKNWCVYYSQKGSIALEMILPLSMGVTLLIFRGLLQLPHYSQEMVYPDFSPNFLPVGTVPDIDAIFHPNRSNRAGPIAETVCEIIRRGQLNPETFSTRSLMNVANKLRDADLSKIDFKRPEITNLLKTIDLSALIGVFSAKILNDDIRDFLQFLLELSSAEDLQENLVEIVTDILQARRLDIISKIEELKNKTAAGDHRLKRWIVFWSPVNNTLLSSIMNEAAATGPFISCGLHNSSLLLDALTRPLPFSQEYYTLAGVSFPDGLQEKQELPENLQVTLRFPGFARYRFDPKSQQYVKAYQTPARKHWETMNIFPMDPAPGPRNSQEPEGGSPGYYQEGFLGLQASISEAIIRHSNRSSGGKMPPMQIRLQRFPNPPAYNDPDGHIMTVLVLFFCNAFFVQVISTVRRIVAEKESHFKEILRILGVERWLLWASWFIPAIAGFLVISLFITVVLKMSVFGRTVFPFSEFVYIFAVMVAFSIVAVFLCFFISAFFSTAENASVAAGAFWVFSCLLFVQCEQRSLKVSQDFRILLSFFPSCGLHYALKTIWGLESTGQGLNKETFDYSPPDSRDVPISTLIHIMLTESVVLLFATLYQEAVNPGPLGIALPWYFPFSRQFWFGDRKTPYVEVLQQDDASLESEPKNLSVGVQIRGLRKVYDNGKVAVDCLSLNLYEGQITVLLGHNGAGKTTTMSMLTGMTAPSAGTAIIADYDLVQNLKEIRKLLGVCPQGNLLVDDLTVSEHLYFFCKLKGLPEAEIRVEINKYLKLLQLATKTATLSRDLSGGMKRKLATALALCGGTKIVLLDEPTSGMDPTARRALWDLLKAEKAGRTILLTTHFMDEADFLGDRIAIMSEGRLKAVGSSFFLKKKYGGGYRMVLTKNQDCKTDRLLTAVRKHCPGIDPQSDVGSEISFELPDCHAADFPNLFRDIERNQEHYGINSFGIISASIDDVFMNVISKTPLRSITKKTENEYSNEVTVPLGVEPPSVGVLLLIRQFATLFTKHWTIMTRTRLAHLFALLFPAIFALFSVATSSQWQGTYDPSPRSFSYKYYPNGYAAVFGNSSPVTDAFREIIDYEGGTTKNFSTATSPIDAILKLSAETPLTSQAHFITALDVQSENITAFFNNAPFHSAPLALQHAYNSFLRAEGGKMQLDFINHPQPFSGISKTIIVQNAMNTSFHLAYQGALVLAIVSAWLMMSHAREKKTGVKLMQFMAGVNPAMYWTVAYVWDLLFGVLSVVFFALVPYWYQEEGFDTIEDASKIVLIGSCFFVVALVIGFVFTFLFSEPSKLFTNISFIGYLAGAFGFIFLTIVRVNSILLEATTDHIVELLIWSPYFSVAESLLNVKRLHWMRSFCEPIYETFCPIENVKHICCKEATNCPEEKCTYWTDDFLDMTPPGIGLAIKINFIVAAIAGFVLLSIENRLFKKLMRFFRKPLSRNWKPIDEDVEREWQLVRNISPTELKSCNLIVSELSKNYGKLQAVKGLSLIIPAGECFGLLGVNGAGKTTTFRMLTGDLEPSSGDVFVHGFSLRNHQKQIHRNVGYCPQFDALMEEFTGRETLRMFCNLRGVPEAEVELTCEKLARDLLFYPYIDHMVKNYSGGNKRKLSTAVALAGDPPVVFLDEPTTGMDPVAKRYFWDVISNLRKSGKTIILTSHSMEECEALCTRVGIMVSGELLCLGSPQHLKTKFAQGHCLTVKIGRNSMRHKLTRRILALDYIRDNIPGAVLNEEHDSVYTYHIPSNCSAWSEMFKTLENARAQHYIEDYYLGQTSLEEVFLSIAAEDQKSE